ncbi:ABC transporter substrate-binding protein [Bacillus sp. SD088]|uniref:ABC transporter substrate-binding protein n=1 Tax=Bacillus sp. SD088 TaxID=2782012 RepID=UPI001A972AC0|nr:extracellular solute-binding protein [Bacillus sp. SD088]MBO0994731.1 extracellular solute-binding protein [Bacillus sp. SD088]
MKLIFGNRITLIFSSLLCCVLIFSGCTAKKEQKVSADGEPEPITLKIHFGEDENFINSYIKPAEEEFPYITFEHVEGSYEELNAAGSTPDIVFHWNKGGLADQEEYGLAYDMTELIEQSGFDISRFDPNQLAEWQTASHGETWVLPIMTSRWALMYNKDVFDAFGVEYPEDGMNWEEVIDLAEKVTGERNGMEYQGLYMPKHEAPIFWTTGNFVDPESDEPLWTEDGTIRDYFNSYQRAYSIPGNPYIPEHWEEGGWVELFEQGKLAMVAQFFSPPNPEANINWDIATYPEPENGVASRGWAMGISATSEHKEEVMKVFDFWFSDEQLLNNTFISGPLYVPFPHLYENGAALDKANEREGEIWENRNMEALFSLPTADSPEKISDYDEGAIGTIDGALYELVTEDQTDLNTLLRQKYDEEINRIKDEKGKK